MPIMDSVRNKGIESIVKDIMAQISKHKLVVIIAALVVLAGSGFGIFRVASLTEAETSGANLKNFSENNYGFSIDYPGNWSFDVGYDRYASGLINADISNKKCGSFSGACKADCVDVRVLAGKKPEGAISQALFVQLYENLLAVKDTNNPDLVQKLEIGGKTIYKVLADGPTLSLNGACGGPLYIFETGAGYFTYVFTGFGSAAASTNNDTIQRIISSIEIEGKQ